MNEKASDRLVATAIRLFQERGYACVGINEIIREAGVARMSLYNNFASKEELAVAAYTALSERRQASFDEAIAHAANPESAVLAIFDLAADISRIPGFRGCAFINLAGQIAPDETRLNALVARHKQALRQRFEELAGRCGTEDAERVGRQLLALWDGAIADSAIEGTTASVEAAKAAAEQLVGLDG